MNFISNNGITFKLKKVSRFVVLEALKKYKTPKPPVMWVEDKSRNEENPQDPTYLEEVREFDTERGIATINIYLSMGTEVMTLPIDIEPMDGSDWYSRVVDLGVPEVLNKYSRYTAWLRFYAMEDDELTKLVTEVMKYSGLTLETDVQTAGESFKSVEARDANPTTTLA